MNQRIEYKCQTNFCSCVCHPILHCLVNRFKKISIFVSSEQNPATALVQSIMKWVNMEKEVKNKT